jgi:hypothetical protein
MKRFGVQLVSGCAFVRTADCQLQNNLEAIITPGSDGPSPLGSPFTWLTSHMKLMKEIYTMKHIPNKDFQDWEE